ncbi:MAG: hypothetical protein ABJA98_01825 [Acidobacteriota bacterium]
MTPRFLRAEVVPFVDVELVPAPDQVGPIVEVEIIPVTELRRLQQLKTLAEMHAAPRAVPKRYTTLDRAITRKAARLEDARKLRTWAAAVKDRDQWKDRQTGVRVRSTRTLDPLRAEAHHIEPKADQAVRYDIRNGITLSCEHHFDVEHFRYRIEGTAWFVAENGCRYIDGTYPVIFVRL